MARNQKLTAAQPSRRPQVWIVTGTPATGKTTLALGMASEIGGRLIDANAIAVCAGCVKSKTKREELVIDLRKLKAALLKIINSTSVPLVLDGHLLCEISLPAYRVVVLRSHPKVLKQRMLKRGYAQGKIDENLLAEILDYCLVAAEQNYEENKIMQVDSSNSKGVKALIKQARASKSFKANWMPLLLTPQFQYLTVRVIK